MHLRALLVLACVAPLAVASSAGASVFNVSPGPGTPLQDAIDAASPGDTIRLANGVFHEAIEIDKPLPERRLSVRRLVDGLRGRDQAARAARSIAALRFR